MAETDGGANYTAATMAETFGHRGDADNGLRLLETTADVDDRVRRHSGDAGRGGGGGQNKGRYERPQPQPKRPPSPPPRRDGDCGDCSSSSTGTGTGTGTSIGKSTDSTCTTGPVAVLKSALAKYPHMSLSLSPPFNRRRNLPSYRGRCSL
ncbi:hypothetical protein QTP88_007487 [Uroleucon formosanum]